MTSPNSLSDFEWHRDLTTYCGDPNFMAESVANWAKIAGIDNLLLYVMPLYSAPLLLVGGLYAAVFYVRRKKLVVNWPDAILLLVPPVVWLLLVLIYPIGKPLMSIFDLPILGVLAALSIIMRRHFPARIRLEAAKVSVLGTTSLAVMFWAFMPAWMT